jgi:hypothetical protein
MARHPRKEGRKEKETVMERDGPVNRDGRARVPYTAFVSCASRGNACARLCDPTRPYATIAGAVAAIRQTTPLATTCAAACGPDGRPPPPQQWTVRLEPGSYAEAVVLPPRVGIVGAGQGATTIMGSIVATGSGRIESIGLQASSLPALRVAFDSAGQHLALSDVRIEALRGATVQRTTRSGRRAVVAIEPTSESGAAGAVSLDRATIVADLTASGGPDVPGGGGGGGTLPVYASVAASGTRASIRDADVQVRLAPSAGLDAIAAEAGARIDIEGGSVSVTVGPTPPEADIAVLAASGAGAVYQVGPTVAYVLEAILAPDRAEQGRARGKQPVVRPVPDSASPYEAVGGDGTATSATVHFARAGSEGLVWSAGAVVDLSTVPLGSAVLASADAPASSATVLGCRSRFGFVPPVRGNVTYAAESEGGNVATSGGLYANVRTLASDRPGVRHFLADSDSTVLLDGSDPPTLVLEDPARVDAQVLYRGKIATVKNASTTAAAAVEGPILDTAGAPLVLQPLQAATLQNDGVRWFVLSRS